MASVAWPLEIGQTVDPWDTLQRWVVKGFFRSMCGICGQKKSVFLVESLKPRRTLGSSFQHPGWMSPGTATCCYPAVHRSWNPSSSCRNSMPILYLGAEGDMGRSPGHFGMATMLWQRCYPKRKQKQVAICGESDSGNHVAMAFRCLRTIRG